MILRNGQPFNIDAPFTIEDGTQFPSNWYRLASPENREKLGFTEVPDPEPKDDRFYFYNTVDNSWTEKPLDMCKLTLKNQLAAIRWGKETAGIVYANSVFSTDDQSKVNYLAASMQAQANSEYIVLWKAKTNENMPVAKFVDLTANDVLLITKAGMNYISKCFENEQTLSIAIDNAKNLNSLLKIDLNDGWPSREY